MSARSAARWPDPGAGRTRLLPALARGRGPLMECLDRGEPGAEELSRLLALEPWRACALRGLEQLLLQAQLHVGGVPLRPRPGVDRPALQIPAEILRRRRELRGGQLGDGLELSGDGPVGQFLRLRDGFGWVQV